MTRSIAQNIVNLESDLDDNDDEFNLSEEKSYLKELEIVCEWIKLEASRKKSGAYMSSLSNRVVKFLRKNGFTVHDSAGNSYYIDWSEPSEE